MVHEKSGPRFRQGVPAGLSMAKSAVREKPSAVQQSAKQLPQSGRSDSRSVAGEKGVVGSFDVTGMWSSLDGFGEGPGARGTHGGVPLEGAQNHRSEWKRTGTAASTLVHRESKNVTAEKSSISPAARQPVPGKRKDSDGFVPVLNGSAVALGSGLVRQMNPQIGAAGQDVRLQGTGAAVIAVAQAPEPVGSLFVQ